MIREVLDRAKRVVVKIGSNTLTTATGEIDVQRVADICQQVVWLTSKGKQVILVSSGARVCGAGQIGKWARYDDMCYKQALCAIGQIELLQTYKAKLRTQGRQIAQLLLTREDFADSRRVLNIRNTLFTLLDEGVIPIVNENDTVSIKELEIGDNDTLAARVASLASADVMVILSDIDGVFSKNPHKHADARLITKVDDIDKLQQEISIDAPGALGRGGIQTKLQAARILQKLGVPTIITNGKEDAVIRKIYDKEKQGTIFV